MPDVFISYARANEAVAKRVATALGSSGLEVWRDDQLPAHRAYSEVIEQRLRDSNAVVVLWSKEAAQSQWVRAEADYARNQRKLVQAQLDGTLPPMPFNQIQCADLRGWRGKASHIGFAKLLTSVRAVVAGEEASPPAAHPEPSRWRQRRVQLAAAAALLLLVAAAFLLTRLMPLGEQERPILAVLPFQSLDERDSSLVAGMWEDTRQALSRNPQLLVLGPNTSEELAGRGEEATRRAADYVLEASVRSAGERIRVNTNLVRTDDGAQLWSENFDRKLDDVFALQSEIASEIEGRIRGRLARSGGVRPEHIATTGEVYALYSDARAKIRDRQPSSFEQAFDQLERVVAMDPNFAPGWATLAVAANFGAFSRVPRDAQERQAQERRAARRHIDRAETFARRAIALAPNLAAGHAALGLVLGLHRPEAQAALRRAIALDPNDVEAMNWLAGSLDPETQVPEKLELYSKITEIEPLWWPAVVNKLGLLLEARDYAAAEKERERLENLGSTLMAGMAGVAIENARGDLSKAAEIGVRTFNAVSPEERNILGYEFAFLLLKLGYFDEAEANFDFPGPAPYLWRNDPRGLDMVEALDFPPRRFFTQGPLPFSAARVYVLSGRSARLADLYRSTASSADGFASAVGDDVIAQIAPTIAVALRQSGDAAEADRLLALAESRLKRQEAKSRSRSVARIDHVIAARIYAAQGRKTDALHRLSAAVRAGWIPDMPWMPTDLTEDPPLALLGPDPRFQALRQHILDHIAKERAELGPVRLN